jgi:hypothetical protein
MTALNPGEQAPVPLVQNGTSNDPEFFESLVERYLTFGKKTAANVLKLAETLAEAKSQLLTPDLKRFCVAVRLEHEGSTFRKLLVIGQKVSRFETYIERLPCNWTTLYKLASLEGDEFDQVTKDDSFGPTMTAADVERVAFGPPNGISESLSRDLTIDLSGLNRSVKAEVLFRLQDLKGELGFRLEIGKALARELDDTRAACRPDFVEAPSYQ